MAALAAALPPGTTPEQATYWAAQAAVLPAEATPEALAALPVSWVELLQNLPPDDLRDRLAQAEAAAAARDEARTQSPNGSSAAEVPAAEMLTAFPASHPHGARNYTAGMLQLVEQSVRALAKGVSRTHVVSPSNGALLQELFTRDGCGLLISRDIYDGIRPATAR